MTESNLNFAKIVANPSALSWSQVYSAGKLFAVISLETTEEVEEKDYLNVLGKEILNTLEQEFFTLETKDLDSIKQAVEATAKKIPEDLTSSFVIGSVVNNILYVYILGNGKISIKREGKIGDLLESSEQKAQNLKVTSGFLQDSDVLILQTKQFSNVVSTDTLSKFLDDLSPTEAAENIAPYVHEKEEAGAAAIIISYKTPVEDEEVILAPKEDEPEIEEIKNEEEKEKEEVIEPVGNEQFYAPKIENKQSLFDKVKLPLGFFSNFRISKKIDLNHPRKVILTIVVIILLVLIGSIFFAVKKQQETQVLSTFNSIYPPALKKYQEGQGLVGLNQSLADDSFNQAKSILNSGASKLPKDSSQAKQVATLMSEINTALGSAPKVSATSAKPVDASLSPLLLAETKNSALYFSEDDNNIYGLTSTLVFSLDQAGNNKKTIITNSSDWKTPAGIAPYNGNIYILDKSQNQILKYIAASSGFSKANYFSGTTPDFSKAVAMAIDSSVYVLSSDGTINKFTKGAPDTFTLSGLDKSLSSPTKIFTNASLTNIYVLDNGNSRILVLDKTGHLNSQYQASIIKSAKDFDIDEKNKKAYVLNGDKVYEIDLK